MPVGKWRYRSCMMTTSTSENTVMPIQTALLWKPHCSLLTSARRNVTVCRNGPCHIIQWTAAWETVLCNMNIRANGLWSVSAVAW